MADYKLVISDPKTGKSYQKEAKEPDSKSLSGLQIGDKVKGETIDMAGYEFEITGGSDFAGFPMRKDVKGILRKKILAVKGTGLAQKDKGIRVKKLVAGNTISEKTAQINLKVIKYGKEPLEPKEEKAEEKKEPAEKAEETK
ncbi:30S ribosomal protein S6e [Candidatus Woesearchaeota archaeon]|nr:30S ribosomal protein S6e [Candidatus Woesearchaeota archaeon]